MASLNSSDWAAIAVEVTRSPDKAVYCPGCGKESISGEWTLLDLEKHAIVDLSCGVCGQKNEVQIDLPREGTVTPNNRRVLAKRPCIP